MQGSHHHSSAIIRNALNLAFATRALIATLSLIAWLTPCNVAFAAEPWPADFYDDADLHDVFFLDANTGWAVGDRGVVLHTSDGGTTWNYQTTPVGDSLHAIHFLDAQRGWAVGGSAVPHTSRGRGIILRTDNGGRTWLIEKVRTLPILHEVRFFDAQQGVAIGDASPLYPAAAFTTRDGGRTWNPFPVRTAHGWTAADFRPNGRGLLLGTDGRITTCDGPKCQARSTPRLGGSSMRDIAWIDEVRAIAVGERGKIWLSPDAGVQWHDVSETIARDATVDFHSVESDGTNIWIGAGGRIAGANENAYILRSTDGGQSWEAVTVPTRLPIAKIAFDATSGQVWTAGPFGQVLKSADRGATWQDTRGDDRRLLALAIFDDTTKVTWPLIAQVGGEYGGRTRVVVIEKEAAAALSMPRTERLHQAALAVGASNADSIYLPLSTPDRSGRIANKVAQMIQTWQPTLVITGGEPAFTQSVVAAAQVVDPQLSIWQSDLTTSRPTAGTITVSNAEVVSSLGASVGLLTSTAYSLLGQSLDAFEQRVRCFPIHGASLVGDRITSGFTFAVGSSVRRAATVNAIDRRSLEQVAQQHALLQQLIRRAVADPERGGAWLAQAENMTSSLTAAAAANVLYDLAHQQFATGDVESASATLGSIVAKYPNAGVYDAALRDGVLWSTSREVAFRRSNAKNRALESKEKLADDGKTNATPATFESGRPPAPETPIERGASIPLNRLIKSGPTLSDQLRVQPTSIVTSAKINQTESPTLFTSLPTWLERLGPEHLADPDLQLAIESHRRRIHQPGVRQQAVFKRLSRTLPGKWRDCAAAELALLDTDRNSIKPILTGRQGDRPRLDGRLDAADRTTWPDSAPSTAKRHPSILIPLASVATTEASDSQATPTGLVLLAADEKFLYIAIRCQQQPGAAYLADLTPRTHDADLSRHDRVSILIDTDRDYSLAWRLTIDHRGWTGESLDSDTSWNPRWYVAAGDPTTTPPGEWICEAAIAWSELADAPPTTKDPWGLSVVRHLPDGQRIEWPTAAGKPQRMEHAGLFSFAP